jgi:AhpD family alkylhydroperoxidase
MVLRLKERELVAVGVSVAAGCKPCADYHIAAARKARANSDDIRRAIADGLGVRRHATEIMRDHALSQLGDNDHTAAAEALGEVDRLGALIGLGAAFAVNCTQCFGQLRSEAEAHGVTTAEIADVAELARMIKDKAASHVERLACGSDAEVTSAAE